MRFISFGHYHFRLALWTHYQIHQKSWHGSDKSSFLQCQGFENVWSNHPSLLKWSNPGCILFVSGQVCSCLMIRRTSQRMSLVPSLFFCLLCLLICIAFHPFFTLQYIIWFTMIYLLARSSIIHLTRSYPYLFIMVIYEKTLYNVHPSFIH